MTQVLALILAGGRVDELSVLTLQRPKSAVPFGGMYRIIDFSLSNLMHSGVENVGILSQYRSYSLINHIGIGSPWDFVGRDRGATLLLPSTGHQTSDWYKGTCDAVYQNLEFVMERDPQTVLILSGDHVYQMRYTRMLEYHLQKNADLTVAFAEIAPKESPRFGVAEIDEEDGEVGGRILNYREKPKDAKFPWASLTIYCFNPEVLYHVLEENARSSQSHEFGRDIIPMMLEKYRVYGYKFDGYWGYTRTIDEYWQTNMDLLGEHPKIDLEQWQVRTNLDHDNIRDRPPAVIGKEASIENSVVHNGCRIEGTVLNSILFPGVIVEKGAEVKDSILFFDTVIHSEARVDKLIADFDVEIGRESEIGTDPEKIPNKRYPDLLNSGTSLIGKGAQIPSKIKIGKNCIVAPSLKEKDFSQTQYGSGLTIS